MTGQARVTGNTNRQTGERVNAQGGGIALIGASLVMRDDAKIDRNMTIASGLYSSTLGGGIYANNSAVELTGNAVIQGNAAGSAPQNYYSEGGGIYSTTSGTVILRENAVVRGNIAGVEGTYTHGQALGGGICAVNGVSVLVEDSAKVENNSALSAGYSEGGGIYINIAYLRLRGDAHVRGNLARGGDSSDTGTSTLYACGGGIFTKIGVFDMDGGHISGNIAQGGNYTGVYTSRNIYAHGGGVFIMQASNMYMTGGEITGNFARAGTITQEAAGAQRTATSASESAGGGIYLESPLYMSGGVISANTAGTPAGAGYGYGSAILCGDSPAQLYISGTASIPAQTDSTDDKEDSRNTVAAKFYSTTAKGTTNHQNAPVLFMGELTGSEPIIIDIVSKDALPSGTVEKFIDEGGRILFWQSSALVYPPLPGRFTLGRFVELNSTISSADYYQFKSTDISSTHEIGADGRIKQQ
jgi:hypothetical protein